VAQIVDVLLVIADEILKLLAPRLHHLVDLVLVEQLGGHRMQEQESDDGDSEQFHLNYRWAEAKGATSKEVPCRVEV